MTSAPTVLAAFMASSVEAVEAATVVLAVGSLRGWRSALTGTVAALAVLGMVVAVFGTAIAAIPIATLQWIVGTLLLLFGIRWLRKAMLRSAGVIDLRDEAAVYAQERSALAVGGATLRKSWDAIAALTAFKAVALEGVEVIVIVIGIGAAGSLLVPASIGAAAGCLLVTLAVALLNRPLARVPENTLKYAVGIMVSSFGLFWFGEGIGVPWRLGDATLLPLMALLLAASSVGVAVARRVRA